ncbi:MAG: glycosyltransferase family 2 protein [Prolixibacteraceae bacterium]|nr:glycosyltransferase family 2 protein [Prolixibacteraceae bacterium]
MALTKPKLTIAIPTYNRYTQILFQVRRLLPQLNEEVKLIVRDNNSQEAIENLFSFEELELFKIERNHTNIGADANIIRLFEFCETKWIWVLSDDDFVLDNAVAKILSIIQKYEDFIFINIDHNRDIELIGFDAFVNDLSLSKESFGDAFWISKGIYNIEVLRPYLIYFYKNISSMIGQLIFLLKCLEENPTLIVKRLKCEVFEYKENGISWSHEDFIKYSSIIFQIFDRKKVKFLNRNLFKIIISTYLSMLIGGYRNNKYLNARGNHNMFKFIYNRYGFLRTIFTFPIKSCVICLFIIFPNDQLNCIINILKKNKIK